MCLPKEMCKHGKVYDDTEHFYALSVFMYLLHTFQKSTHKHTHALHHPNIIGRESTQERQTEQTKAHLNKREKNLTKKSHKLSRYVSR